MLKKYFQFYKANTSERDLLNKFYGNFSIKDVIFLIAKIWQETPKSTLEHAWRNLNINTDINFEPESEIVIPAQTIIPGAEVRAWLNNPEETQCWRVMNNDEIVAELLAPEENLGEDIEEEQDEQEQE